MMPSYGSMCDTLVRHGVDHTIVWWIRATLEGCGDSQCFIHEDCGNQGLPTGVLWLLLWCLVVEALTARVSGGETHIQGYIMTSVYLWWENSQTKCHGSYNGPITL